MRNCFIPKCDVLCRNNPRRMMFLAPKDEKMFKVWKEILPKKREFKSIDKVCERHFVKDAILTTFDHVINGELLQMERGRPRLKADAIPTLNLEVEETVNVEKSAKRPVAKSCSKRLSRKVQRKISTNDEELEDIVIGASPPKIQKDGQPIYEVDPLLSKPDEEEVVATAIATTVVEVLPQFELLYDDIFEVTLPSMLWGVHRECERQYIAFTCFDIAHMQNTKCVALSSNGCLKIALNGRIISEQYFGEELTAEFMSNVLNEVDETRFCVNWNERKECSLIAANGSPHCALCS